MGMRFLTGGKFSLNGFVGLAFVLERSVNGDATAGVASVTRQVAEKGGHSD